MRRRDERVTGGRARALGARAREWMRAGAGAAERRAEQLVGGPARLRVILLLGAALGLSGADAGTVSATADNLIQAFHIGTTEVGLLVSVSLLVAAVVTIPVGILTDRINRTRLLAASVVLWGAAIVAASASPSYGWLLVSRAVLGAVTATAGPTIASLTGDYFPAAERGRIWGFILLGELVGTGIGFVVSGELAVLIGWRAAFWWLAIPAVVLVWQLWKLPEPARGGQSRLSVGQDHITGAREIHDHPERAGGDDGSAVGSGRSDVADRAVRRSGVQPDERMVLHEDPSGRSIWWAVRYVLSIRTNVYLIVASALGYFYFSGMRSFVILFVTRHYGVPKSIVTLLVLVIGAGALAGVYFAGRLTDKQVAKGHLSARVLVPAGCLFGIVAVFTPAVLMTSIAVALPLIVAGAAMLGAVNPPVDAARLDIMPAGLWGRAEGVRTTLRTLGEAAAPTLFGLVAAQLFHNGPFALAYTFVIFLITLVAAGVLALFAVRTYARDVATASASRHEVDEKS